MPCLVPGSAIAFFRAFVAVTQFAGRSNARSSLADFPVGTILHLNQLPYAFPEYLQESSRGGMTGALAVPSGKDLQEHGQDYEGSDEQSYRDKQAFNAHHLHLVGRQTAEAF
jgi:hypothetical protein